MLSLVEHEKRLITSGLEGIFFHDKANFIKGF